MIFWLRVKREKKMNKGERKKRHEERKTEGDRDFIIERVSER